MREGRTAVQLKLLLEVLEFDRPGLDLLLDIVLADGGVAFDRQKDDLATRCVLRVREAVAGEPRVVRGEVAGRDGQPPLWDDEHEQAARAQRTSHHRREERVLQAFRFVVVVVRRVQPEARERPVRQPHRKGTSRDHMLDGSLRLIGTVPSDLDAVRLASDDIGDLSKRGSRTTARIEQPNRLPRRLRRRSNERRDPARRRTAAWDRSWFWLRLLIAW